MFRITTRRCLCIQIAYIPSACRDWIHIGPIYVTILCLSKPSCAHQREEIALRTKAMDLKYLA